MSINQKDLYQMIDHLRNEEKKTVYDFMRFLNQRSKNKPEYWTKIDTLDPDKEDLSKEELDQLQSDEGFVTREDAKREPGIQTDLP